MINPFGAWPRVAIVAFLGAATVIGVAWATDPLRFATSPQATFLEVEREVRGRFAQVTTALIDGTAQVADHPEVVQRLGNPGAALTSLFDLTATIASDGLDVTVYDNSGAPRAWSGHPSELPRERILGDGGLFVTAGRTGLRLVHLEPIRGHGDGPQPADRIGSVAAERVLSPIDGFASGNEPFPIDSRRAPVTLQPASGDASTTSAAADGSGRFVLASPGGEPLLEVAVTANDPDTARARWWQTARRWLLAAVAALLLLAALPELILAPRRAARQVAVRRTILGAAGLVGASVILWTLGARAEPATSRLLADGTVVRSPADVLLIGLLLGTVAITTTRFVDGARLAWRTRPGSSRGAMLMGHLAAGGATAIWLGGCETVMRSSTTRSLVSLLDASIDPWNPTRLAVLLGLLVGASSSIWLGAQPLVLANARWNRRRHRLGAAAVAAWALPSVAILIATPIPAGPYLPVVGAMVGITLLSPHVRPRLRHGSESGRLTLLLTCLVLPAVLAYPPMAHHRDVARRTSIQDDFAPATVSHAESLLASLSRVRDDIDAYLAQKPVPVSEVADGGPTPDEAFALWRQTDLADQRLSSAIELYDDDGALSSRFALDFPEYSAAAQSFQPTGCTWTVYGEVSPFGSQERRLLHAERAICGEAVGGGLEMDGYRLLGSVIVHVPLDYESLPFIPADSPYGELIRPPSRQSVTPMRLDSDLALAIYGWGLSTIFTSGASAWTIDENLFNRIYASREPFWTTLRAGGVVSDVFISNDRSGIYAVGYRRLTWFDHAVRLAELVAIMGMAFLAWLLVMTLVGPFTRERYRVGRELARELRVSFYRRLFLAFVVIAVAPVLVLAVVIRNYSTVQLRADIQAGAAQTAITAQRVIDELEQAGGDTGSVLTDDLLVFVSQILDQDVHIYDGPHLVATSERDLFASGLLPTRTPSTVYNAIALARAPSFVTEDRIGPQSYLVAAAPIRSVGPDAILAVPLASQQREIERQITNLDRGLLLGVTLLILLGAGSGFYIAERIADPVQRLTRATRRIARGDFDARIATRSADELARLVGSFNQMAQELAEQRRRLERTNRLEAWAEMARQVAHDIKNPLTPVQLSAEHLQRVHRDRGEPLGPVMHDCIDAILKQVRILRQIASEFSSYAVSPPVAPEPTALDDLVAAVLGPYRVGLRDRIRLDIDVPSTLPLVSIDRSLIARALTNIIENALHAMADEGTLAIAARTRDDAVDLTVHDSGVGLDEATLARIFEPYFSTRTSGTGLGMAIAKRNVELNGGTIAVASAKGAGTTVTLRFPVAGATTPT